MSNIFSIFIKIFLILISFSLGLIAHPWHTHGEKHVYKQSKTSNVGCSITESDISELPIVTIMVNFHFIKDATG